LFGTGLPARNPGAVLGQLNFADVDSASLAAIAGGTLRRLLSWHDLPLPEPDVVFPPPPDELHEAAGNGGPLQGLVCGHGHLGRHNRVHVPGETAADLVADMDRLGVGRAVIFANTGMDSDEVHGNNLVAAAVRRFPERLVGFVMVNLHRSPAEIRREIDRGWAMGLRGIKLHPSMQSYNTTGPNVDLACALANERRAFIVNHFWGDLDRLQHLCTTYPDACFMTGHTRVDAGPLARARDNLVIGTCSLTGYSVIEDLVAAAGPERVLFTSDISWDPPAWVFGPILYARIPIAAKRLILGENLRRLLARYGV